MSALLLFGGPVFTPFEVIEDGAVFVRDGVIERVGPRGELVDLSADDQLDVGGRLVCPGFVDLQVNGGGGALLTEQPTVETVERIVGAHLRFGATALLPTVVTAQEAQMARALAAVREAMARPPAGARARVLGAHLEGPFINPKRKGAHDERLIQPPSREAFDRLRAAAGGALRLITLAPELPGALDLVSAAREAGVAVAIGHTEATYEEAKAAFDAGASLGTHLFNAMPPLHHRAPGAVGALLENERAAVSVIADGVHVHPALLALVARAKGAGRTVLVTDAMPPVGAEGASFRLSGREVRVRDGACYLPDGTLAGSALSLDRAIWTMHQRAGLPLRACVEMATATPARLLGLGGVLGELRPGARADIVICGAELNVWRVFVGGALAYAAES